MNGNNFSNINYGQRNVRNPRSEEYGGPQLSNPNFINPWIHNQRPRSDEKYNLNGPSFSSHKPNRSTQYVSFPRQPQLRSIGPHWSNNRPWSKNWNNPRFSGSEKSSHQLTSSTIEPNQLISTSSDTQNTCNSLSKSDTKKVPLLGSEEERQLKINETANKLKQKLLNIREGKETDSQKNKFSQSLLNEDNEGEEISLNEQKFNKCNSILHTKTVSLDIKNGKSACIYDKSIKLNSTNKIIDSHIERKSSTSHYINNYGNDKIKAEINNVTDTDKKCNDSSTEKYDLIPKTYSDSEFNLHRSSYNFDTHQFQQRSVIPPRFQRPFERIHRPYRNKPFRYNFDPNTRPYCPRNLNSELINRNFSPVNQVPHLQDMTRPSPPLPREPYSNNSNFNTNNEFYQLNFNCYPQAPPTLLPATIPLLPSTSSSTTTPIHFDHPPPKLKMYDQEDSISVSPKLLNSSSTIVSGTISNESTSNISEFMAQQMMMTASQSSAMFNHNILFLPPPPPPPPLSVTFNQDSTLEKSQSENNDELLNMDDELNDMQQAIEFAKNTMNLSKEVKQIDSNTHPKIPQSQDKNKEKLPASTLVGKCKVTKPFLKKDAIAETNWREGIISKFVKMTKPELNNILNNSSFKKFDVAMERLMKETKSNLSGKMRQIESDKIKSNDNEKFMNQLHSMMLDTTVDVDTLPNEFIHQLSNLLQLDLTSGGQNELSSEFICGINDKNEQNETTFAIDEAAIISQETHISHDEIQTTMKTISIEENSNEKSILNNVDQHNTFIKSTGKKEGPTKNSNIQIKKKQNNNIEQLVSFKNSKKITENITGSNTQEHNNSVSKQLIKKYKNIDKVVEISRTEEEENTKKDSERQHKRKYSNRTEYERLKKIKNQLSELASNELINDKIVTLQNSSVINQTEHNSMCTESLNSKTKNTLIEFTTEVTSTKETSSSSRDIKFLQKLEHEENNSAVPSTSSLPKTKAQLKQMPELSRGNNFFKSKNLIEIEGNDNKNSISTKKSNVQNFEESNSIIITENELENKNKKQSTNQVISNIVDSKQNNPTIESHVTECVIENKSSTKKLNIATYRERLRLRESLKGEMQHTQLSTKNLSDTAIQKISKETKDTKQVEHKISLPCTIGIVSNLTESLENDNKVGEECKQGRKEKNMRSKSDLFELADASNTELNESMVINNKNEFIIDEKSMLIPTKEIRNCSILGNNEIHEEILTKNNQDGKDKYNNQKDQSVIPTMLNAESEEAINSPHKTALTHDDVFLTAVTPKLVFSETSKESDDKCEENLMESLVISPIVLALPAIENPVSPEILSDGLLKPLLPDDNTNLSGIKFKSLETDLNEEKNCSISNHTSDREKVCESILSMRNVSDNNFVKGSVTVPQLIHDVIDSSNMNQTQITGNETIPLKHEGDKAGSAVCSLNDNAIFISVPLNTPTSQSPNTSIHSDFHDKLNKIQNPLHSPIHKNRKKFRQNSKKNKTLMSNEKFSVWTRMMEIDVEINRLMSEKMVLYQALQNEFFLGTEVLPSTVKNPFHDSFSFQQLKGSTIFTSTNELHMNKEQLSENILEESLKNERSMGNEIMKVDHIILPDDNLKIHNKETENKKDENLIQTKNLVCINLEENNKFNAKNINNDDKSIFKNLQPQVSKFQDTRVSKDPKQGNRSKRNTNKVGKSVTKNKKLQAMKTLQLNTKNVHKQNAIYSDDSTLDEVISDVTERNKKQNKCKGLILLEKTFKQEMKISKKSKAIARKNKGKQSGGILKSVHQISKEEEELPLNSLYFKKSNEKKELLESLHPASHKNYTLPKSKEENSSVQLTETAKVIDMAEKIKVQKSHVEEKDVSSSKNDNEEIINYNLESQYESHLLENKENTQSIVKNSSNEHVKLFSDVHEKNSKHDASTSIELKGWDENTNEKLEENFNKPIEPCLLADIDECARDSTEIAVCKNDENSTVNTIKNNVMTKLFLNCNDKDANSWSRISDTDEFIHNDERLLDNKNIFETALPNSGEATSSMKNILLFQQHIHKIDKSSNGGNKSNLTEGKSIDYPIVVLRSFKRTPSPVEKLKSKSPVLYVHSKDQNDSSLPDDKKSVEFGITLNIEKYNRSLSHTSNKSQKSVNLSSEKNDEINKECSSQRSTSKKSWKRKKCTEEVSPPKTKKTLADLLGGKLFPIKENERNSVIKREKRRTYSRSRSRSSSRTSSVSESRVVLKKLSSIDRNLENEISSKVEEKLRDCKVHLIDLIHSTHEQDMIRKKFGIDVDNIFKNFLPSNNVKKTEENELIPIETYEIHNSSSDESVESLKEVNGSNNLQNPKQSETTSFNNSINVEPLIENSDSAILNHHDKNINESIQNTKELQDNALLKSNTPEVDKTKLCNQLEINDKENEVSRLQYTGHNGPVLDIKVANESFIAANEDGNIYRYSLTLNKILNVYKGHKAPVTCLFIAQYAENELIYSGSLDGTLRCYEMINGNQSKEAVEINSAIQCMDQAWGIIFIGTKSGYVSRYYMKSGKIKDDPIQFSETSVLALKATNEGPRRVLIVASRSQPIIIRDATTGLRLRSICGQRTHTVYSLMRHNSYIYCGTSSTSIPVFDFTTGKEITQYQAGVGIVCMQLYRQLLFAGCYNGVIYVFDTRTHKLICSIPGPGNMLLSMEIVGDKIIAGSKDKRLHVWSVPNEVHSLLLENT